jgi:hypothetical protein
LEKLYQLLNSKKLDKELVDLSERFFVRFNQEHSYYYHFSLQSTSILTLNEAINQSRNDEVLSLCLEALKNVTDKTVILALLKIIFTLFRERYNIFRGIRYSIVNVITRVIHQYRTDAEIVYAAVTLFPILPQGLLGRSQVMRNELSLLLSHCVEILKYWSEPQHFDFGILIHTLMVFQSTDIAKKIEVKDFASVLFRIVKTYPKNLILVGHCCDILGFWSTVDVVEQIGRDGFELLVNIIDNFDEYQTEFIRKYYNVQWKLLPTSTYDISLPYLKPSPYLKREYHFVRRYLSGPTGVVSFLATAVLDIKDIRDQNILDFKNDAFLIKVVGYIQKYRHKNTTTLLQLARLVRNLAVSLGDCPDKLLNLAKIMCDLFDRYPYEPLMNEHIVSILTSLLHALIYDDDCYKVCEMIPMRAICKFLKAHSGVESLRRSGANLINNILCGKKIPEATMNILAQEGIDALIEFVKETMQSTAQTEWSHVNLIFRNISRIAFNSKLGARRLAESPTLRYLAGLIEQHPNDEKLLEEVITCWVNMTSHEDDPIIVACDSNIIGLVISALYRFPNHKDIQYFGLRLLNNIATTTRGKTALVAHNAYAMALHSLRVQMNNGSVVTIACSLLLLLLHSGKTETLAADYDTVVTLFLDLWKFYKDTDDVVQHRLSATFSLICSQMPSGPKKYGLKPEHLKVILEGRAQYRQACTISKQTGLALVFEVTLLIDTLIQPQYEKDEETIDSVYGFICDLIKNHSDDKELNKAIWFHFSEIHFGRFLAHVKKCVEKGILPLLIDFVEQNINETFITYALNAFAKFCSYEGAVPMIAPRAMPLLLKVLQIHKNEADIIFATLKALRFLTKIATYDEPRRKMTTLGIALIIEAMETFIKDAELVNYGLSVLSMLGYDAGSDPMRLEIVNQGAFRLGQKIASIHIFTNPLVIANLVGMYRNLLIAEDNCSKFLRVNGIEFLVYVLDNFQEDDEVIALAFTALSLVIEGTADRDFSLLVTDMKRFGTRIVHVLRIAFKKTEKGLLDAATTLWADLAFHRIALLELFDQNGVDELLEVWPQVKDVKSSRSNLIRCLLNASRTSEFYNAVSIKTINEKIFPLVFETIQTFPSEISSLTFSFGMFANIFTNIAERKTEKELQLDQEKLMEIIFNALSLVPSTTLPLFHSILRCLRYLLAQKENRSFMRARFETFKGVLKFAQDVSCAVALQVLLQLADDPEGIEILKNDEVISWIFRVRCRLPNDKEIKQHSDSLFQKLNVVATHEENAPTRTENQSKPN